MSFVHQTIEQTEEEIIHDYERLIFCKDDIKTPHCGDTDFHRKMYKLFTEVIKFKVGQRENIKIPIYWVERKDTCTHFNGSVIVPSDRMKIPKNKFIEGDQQQPEEQEIIAVYEPNPKGLFIWVDKVWEASKGDENVFEIYLLQVMLHVYANAYMDEGRKYDDEFISYYKESSLAEGISLYQLQKYYRDSPDDIEFLNFIPRRMPYALGNLYKREDLLFPAVKKWMNTKKEGVLKPKDELEWWNIIKLYPFISNKKIYELINFEES